MSKKIPPFVNPTVFYEQLFQNNGHMFDGRNQGKSISQLPEPDQCLECLENFSLSYPVPSSDLPPLDRKYIKMKGGVSNLIPRVAKETKEMNERIYEEELFVL
jgi:hypothetical protein